MPEIRNYIIVAFLRIHFSTQKLNNTHRKINTILFTSNHHKFKLNNFSKMKQLHKTRPCFPTSKPIEIRRKKCICKLTRVQNSRRRQRRSGASRALDRSVPKNKGWAVSRSGLERPRSGIDARRVVGNIIRR